MSEHHHYHGQGISLGFIVAALLSWTVNHSILWSIVHGFCGIFYILYWACVHWN